MNTPIVIGDSKAIYGFPPELPLQLAPNIVQYKIRARSQEFARIFLKVASTEHARWEEWYLGCDGDHLFPWIQKGENVRKRP